MYEAPERESKKNYRGLELLAPVESTIGACPWTIWDLWLCPWTILAGPSPALSQSLLPNKGALNYWRLLKLGPVLQLFWRGLPRPWVSLSYLTKGPWTIGALNCWMYHWGMSLNYFGEAFTDLESVSLKL